ncbi:hypothetical protein [Archangium lipolyticum]|uniref:hypothetical protein n=1 Tax=Archangium lipolyticum TaxID=2970465 RepID=UPI0021499E6E|nr:hypothetical protein [Archangium lipolyticum]
MRRGLGLALLAALVLHAATKGQARLPEMLWVCHVASVLLAMGLLTSVRWLVAVGFLIHVGMGMPAFLIDVLFGERPSPTSWLVHLLPLVAGWSALRGTGLPPRTWKAAWAIVLVTFTVSILATPPVLNVNVMHEAWGPMRGLFPGAWAVRVFHALEALGLLFGAELLLRQLIAPAAAS